MRNLKALCVLGAAACLFSTASIASAMTVHSASGLNDEGEAISAQAQLSISGDLLTLTLQNTSAATLRPSSLLTSYYFDVISGAGVRPELELVSATGDVWETSRKDPDVLKQGGADLIARDKKDNTWLFRSFEGVADPFQGFGVSTVGNSDLDPINFNGSIVGGMDYGIYVDEVISQNLNKRLLVKDSVTFVFSGVAGYANSDILSAAAFGFGTSPETILGERPPSEIPPAGVVPEPLTMALFGFGAAGMAGYVRRRIGNR